MAAAAIGNAAKPQVTSGRDLEVQQQLESLEHWVLDLAENLGRDGVSSNNLEATLEECLWGTARLEQQGP